MASHNLKRLAYILVGALVLVCNLAEIDATLNVGGVCHAGFATCKNGRSCQSSLYTDVDNCGRCGVKCPTAPHSLRKCEKGRCDICCNDKEWRNCDGRNSNGCETNVDVNLHHCGKCGNVCTAPENATATCSRGNCGFQCAKGFQKSQKNCSLELHINTVGSCGSTGQVCPNRPNSDATCSGAGTCGFTCHPGFENCDGNPNNGCETDIKNDRANCGTCGGVCTSPPNSDASCSNGTCGFTCHPSFANCDGNSTNGCETDLRTDMNNCGGCNASCVVHENIAVSNSTCSNSTCSLQCTDSSYANCDGIVSNGCEVYFYDVNNCGACGLSCIRPHGSRFCTMSESGPFITWCDRINCDPGWFDCDNSDWNGCESNSWC